MASVASQSLRVVLTGDGADEQLAGYDTYKASLLFNKLLSIKPLVLWMLRVFEPISQSNGGQKLNAKLLLRQMEKALASSHINSIHHNWRRIFSDNALQNLVKTPLLSNASEEVFLESFMSTKPEHVLKSLQAMDIATWMHNDILPKVDRSTMAYGLEARCPFLDKPLAEFSALIPDSIKLKRPKWILRKAMEGLLPDSVIGQKKSGFNTPMAKWFLHEPAVRQYAEHWLLSSQALSHGLLNREYVKALWDGHAAGDNHLELWNLMVLNAWYANYKK